MNKEEFIEIFVEELEIEDTEITENTVLDELDEWDSMASMVVIALFNEKFGKKITGDDIKNMKIVDDLLKCAEINN